MQRFHHTHSLRTLKGRPPFRLAGMETYERLQHVARGSLDLLAKGYEPRLALLAFSTFGHPPGERSTRVIEAVKILDSRRVDFEYDGEMAADVALNPELASAYPF